MKGFYCAKISKCWKSFCISLHITFSSPPLGGNKETAKLFYSTTVMFWFPLCCSFKQKQEQALTAPFPSIHQTGTHRCFITHLLLALMRHRTCIESRGGIQTKHKSHCNCSHSQFCELMLAKTSYYCQLSSLVKNTGTVSST